MTARPLVRCAIYTRKSSEEGLDQAFNSLHAQREACEAYVKSQTSEGWRALPAQYDDAGISGGTIERPALQRLLADVDAGRVDTIVVYKIDRLTRSLADFARIVERLEAKGASFVSVTQAFNTTTSMGRLTLNVLLSFAQFEREVTGERIRDKIAASKRKGMWMGGNLPLGYDEPTDLQTRALRVNAAESETVNAIFQAYLDLGSVSALAAHLRDTEVRPKQRTTRAGTVRGAAHFSRGALYHLLQNRVYLGEITHCGQSYPGAQPAIVPAELFDAVQARIASQRQTRRARPLRSAAMPLTGRLYDIEGERMSPSFGYGRGGQIYRYYVSSPLQQGARAARDGLVLRRVSAPALEGVLRTELIQLLSAEEGAGMDVLLRPVRRIVVAARGVTLVLTKKQLPREVRATLDSVEGETDLGELHLPVSCQVRGGRTWVTPPPNSPAVTRRDPVLLRGFRQAHRIAADVGWDSTRVAMTELSRPAPANAYQRKLVRLAFLAPDIQRSIINGTQPSGLSLDAILRIEMPLAWSKQRLALGFGDPNP